MVSSKTGEERMSATDPSSSLNFPTICPSRSLLAVHSTSSVPCSSIRTSSSFPSFANCGGKGRVDEDEIFMGINMEMLCQWTSESNASTRRYYWRDLTNLATAPVFRIVITNKYCKFQMAIIIQYNTCTDHKIYSIYKQDVPSEKIARDNLRGIVIMSSCMN